jgi:hypothetical protein
MRIDLRNVGVDVGGCSHSHAAVTRSSKERLDTDQFEKEMSEEDKFNMIVNQLFQRDSFGKGFVSTSSTHVHSKYRVKCTSDCNFLTLNKKALVRI